MKKETGMHCKASGLGAGSSQYIFGSAARNGYKKGDEINDSFYKNGGQ